jgi:diguanylate cyclase (GGDEF)-like protein/PAS domain S-box-containing protein
VEQSQATARSLIAGETSGITLEKRYLHKAGHVVWAIVSASVVRDAQGDALYIVSQLQDITDRKRAEDALRESEERWRSLVENAPSFISTIDRDGTVLSINRTLPGLTPEQMIGTSVYDYTHPEYRSQARECYERVFQTGEAGSLETAGIRGDGDPFWYVSLVGPIENDGQIVALTIIATDVTDRKRAEEELQRLNRQLEEINASLEERVRERTEELRLANEELQQRNRQLLDARAQAATDSVTGISNHRTFQERIRDEVSWAEINATTVGLIMLDIDGFKAVNDSQGHLSGDEILRQLASTIEDVVGRERAYRYGGDEFAVLLPLTDRRDTARMAERLRQAAERQNNGDGNMITLSLGVASFPEAAGSAEELIYGADAAMYWAKSAGKNRVGDWADLVKRNGDGSGALYTSDRTIGTIDTVGALVAALVAKDPATGAHVERCSWYALMLAEELGLSEKETSTVRIASLLHDIGKITVPDDVLRKPGPLNDKEWAQMKEHPLAALQVLGQITAIAEATPAILHHHEHFDGSGYPHGLAGVEIPIVSRILLVTDAFDAMTTDRPYRKAMPVEAAIEELKSNMGNQFDPAITEAFLRALARRGAQPLDHAAPAHAKVQAVGPGSGGTC